MNQIIQIILGILVLSFPPVFVLIYLTNSEKRTKKIIDNYSSNSSIVYKDLQVWVKNFDVFRKRKRFDLDQNTSLYSYESCDLILNEKNFVVIGKTKLFGKSKSTSPTIFGFEQNPDSIKSNQVYVEKIFKNGNDLEIEFIDSNYLDKMTLVIKNVDNPLLENIKRATTTYKNNA